MAKTATNRVIADRLARVVVSGGGILVVASILGMVVLFIVEVIPLFQSARLEARPPVPLPDALAPGTALLADEFLTDAVLLGPAGLEVVRLADGRVTERRGLAEVFGAALAERMEAAGTPPRVRTSTEEDLFVAAVGGRLVALPVGWTVSYTEAGRAVAPKIGRPVTLVADPNDRPLGVFAGRLRADGTVIAAAQSARGRLVVLRPRVEENLFTGERTIRTVRLTAPVPYRLSGVAVTADGSGVYAGTADGRLLWWRVTETGLAPPDIVSAGHGGVTALALLFGDRSLAVGQADGGVSVWFLVPRGGRPHLTHIRDFPRHQAPVRSIVPSRRDRGFLVIDRAGNMGLYYSTSERTLWRGRSPGADVTAVRYGRRGDWLLFAAPGRLVPVAVSNRHPEVSWKALFARIWYEGYAAPAFVWQSTGGTDAYEPKFSLTPLIFGTLKGTFYALLLAIPLAILAAMYTSQFMHPNLQRYVKPAVEIMAALPTVILGFLAGLWLAPRLERAFPTLLLMVLVLPLVVIPTGWAWQSLGRRVRRLWPGSELVVFLVVSSVAVWACAVLGDPLEAWLFGGDFPQWLYRTTGLRYDQRNAIIVGIAMGFAVIPIIFSIAEDAFSNVPSELLSGALALGASRWQAVTRVVLPTASPGIFSAIMIGFGRAVGETMIVLMATGNTPILDWSPFNGFRALSANIAVEIPEAPEHGTLYRVLFLSALLLFVLTFVVNTIAEVVRHRLRTRYGHR